GAIVHNGARLVLEHLGDFELHAQPHARQVRRHDLLPIFLGRFDHTGRRPDEPGIVERIVQAAMPIDCTLHHLPHVSRFGHIDAHAARLTAILANHRDRLLGSDAIDVSDDYTGALTWEAQGTGAADARCTPRYHDDLSGHGR